MKPTYSQMEINDICKIFFSDIEQNKFEVKLTVGGSPCIIMSRVAGGDHPLMGCYWSGEEWYPSKWTSNGRYVNKNNTSKLDIDFIKENEVA